MIAADVLCTVLVVVLAGAVLQARHISFEALPLLALEAVTASVILGSLRLNRAWDSRVLGQGAEEFRRLGRSLFGSVVALGLGALAAGLPDARAWAFLVGPAVALLAFPVRYALRRPLHRARSEGRCLFSVLAAGNLGTVSDLIRRTGRAPHPWRAPAPRWSSRPR
nr:hypothetical protein [Saccharothrix syringae]